MGCDVHLHQEIKIKHSAFALWHHYGAPNVPRNYRLFELMAGVRGDLSNAIAPPRGLPADVTLVSRLAFEHEGGHTPSWLSASEIVLLERCAEVFMPSTELKPFYPEIDLQWGYLLGNGWGDFLRYPDDKCTPKWLVDVRFVFWFDS